MNDIQFIWDLANDPRGNVRHIAEHDLTPDEVESAMRQPAAYTETSRTGGGPITFGTTHTGRFIAVVWEHVDDDPLTVYPITAYEPTQDD